MSSVEKDINQILESSNFIYDELFCYFSRLNSIPVYNYKLTKGNCFFRARKNDTFLNFKNLNDLAAPPKHLVRNFNRANTPFQSIFYASDQWITNIAELKLFLIKELAIGDVIWVTQAKWVLIEDLNLIVIPDFDNEKMSDFVNKIVINNLSDDQLQFLNFINKYFRQPIDPDENNSPTYKVTSAFCNALLAESARSKNQIDGILYTSVEHNLGFNIALNPNLVQQNKIKIENIVKHFLRKSSETEFDNFNLPNKPIKIDFENNTMIWV